MRRWTLLTLLPVLVAVYLVGVLTADRWGGGAAAGPEEAALQTFRQALAITHARLERPAIGVT